MFNYMQKMEQKQLLVHKFYRVRFTAVDYAGAQCFGVWQENLPQSLVQAAVDHLQGQLTCEDGKQFTQLTVWVEAQI